MPYINKVEIPEASYHECEVPARHGNDVGTVWQCGLCDTYWGIRRVGDGLRVLDWRRMDSPVKFTSWLSSQARIPKLRVAEPKGR